MGGHAVPVDGVPLARHVAHLPQPRHPVLDERQVPLGLQPRGREGSVAAELSCRAPSDRRDVRARQRALVALRLAHGRHGDAQGRVHRLQEQELQQHVPGGH